MQRWPITIVTGCNTILQTGGHERCINCTYRATQQALRLPESLETYKPWLSTAVPWLSVRTQQSWMLPTSDRRGSTLR